MKKAVFIAFLLGGCDLTTSQERATDAHVCAGYGFKPGTVEFANCQMGRDQQRQTANSALIQQIDRSNRDNAAYLERTITPPTINCASTSIGNQTQTTCR